MVRFLIKNHLIIKFSVLTILFFPGLVWSAPKYQYQLGFDTRYGAHIYGAPDVATQRHSFMYEQKSQWTTEWSTVLGFRTEVEAAYASNTERYGGSDVAKYDSQHFFPRDNYLQYKGDIFRARIGYQQVVWGETFGSYYADVVNPKDFREAGLGDLSRNRLDSPMASFQWIFSNTSVQLIYIPVADYNLIPSAGSDFNKETTLVSSPVKFAISRSPQDPLTRPEVGARLTQQIFGLDLSLFYFNYYDRMPVYRLDSTADPATLALNPSYKPLQTAGLTATFEAYEFLFRSEVVLNMKREFNTINPTGLRSEFSDELIYVLGLDLPQLDKWQFSLQYSNSRLQENNWLGRQAEQPSASARIAKTFANNLAFETTYLIFTADSSSLAQAQVTVPISSQTEILFGVDQFDGTRPSALGRFHDASRVWVMLKATLRR